MSFLITTGSVVTLTISGIRLGNKRLDHRERRLNKMEGKEKKGCTCSEDGPRASIRTSFLIRSFSQTTIFDRYIC